MIEFSPWMLFAIITNAAGACRVLDAPQNSLRSAGKPRFAGACQTFSRTHSVKEMAHA
jgi:hypothetical protein